MGNQVEAGAFTEDADIRIISAHRANQGGYANGYSNSKGPVRCCARPTTPVGCRWRCSAPG